MRDINKELEFLKSRGYEVGGPFVSDEGMRRPISGRACAVEDVLMLVTLENMKSKVTTVRSPALEELASMCGNAADRSGAVPEVAAASRGLETEWMLLLARATPLPASLADKRALDAKAVVLAGRMVAFLGRELLSLSVLSIAQAAR
jgi:hypothetical protein